MPMSPGPFTMTFDDGDGWRITDAFGYEILCIPFDTEFGKPETDAANARAITALPRILSALSALAKAVAANPYLPYKWDAELVDANSALFFATQGHEINPYQSDGSPVNPRLTAVAPQMYDALKKIADRKRLRDLSTLASNPPQNAAVWDIQTIACAVLELVDNK